jgi:hypothetical protein
MSQEHPDTAAGSSITLHHYETHAQNQKLNLYEVHFHMLIWWCLETVVWVHDLLWSIVWNDGSQTMKISGL